LTYQGENKKSMADEVLTVVQITPRVVARKKY
jgi:hypothetical protein